MKLDVGQTRFLEPTRRRAGDEPDHVSIVEAAYQLDLDDDAWLEGVVRAVEPLLNRGFGVIGYSWRAEAGGTTLVVRNQVSLGCSTSLPDALTRAAEIMPPEGFRGFMTAGPCHSHSEARGMGREWEKTREVQEALLPLVGARDMLNIRATNAEHSAGVALGACTRDVTTIPPRTRASFSRVAAHLVAAARLRNAVRPEVGLLPEPQDEAVFDEGGELLHAEGDAESGAARGALVTAVERFMASRGHLRKESPEHALEIWRALVSGRWSILEHTDTDGKRLILARRNEANVQQPASLNANERLVAIYTSRGHSNKLIAYELGLSASTVSSLLRSALKKLGLSSRAELLRLFAPPR